MPLRGGAPSLVRGATFARNGHFVAHKTVPEAESGRPSWSTITDIQKKSSKVVELVLKLDAEDSRNFDFRPGQWVDMFLDNHGVSQIGGFSLTSTPAELPEFKLAIKSSGWPPARWCCEEARPGMRVQCRPGGQFHWTASGAMEGKESNKLVLVAGGIGRCLYNDHISFDLKAKRALRLIGLNAHTPTPNRHQPFVFHGQGPLAFLK